MVADPCVVIGNHNDNAIIWRNGRRSGGARFRSFGWSGDRSSQSPVYVTVPE
jgi:hypothetical protein